MSVWGRVPKKLENSSSNLRNHIEIEGFFLGKKKQRSSDIPGKEGGFSYGYEKQLCT